MDKKINNRLFEVVFESEPIGIPESFDSLDSLKEFIKKHWGEEFLGEHIDILFNKIVPKRKIVLIQLLKNSDTLPILKAIKDFGLIPGNVLALALVILTIKNQFPQDVYIRSLDEMKNLPKVFGTDRKIPSILLRKEGNILDSYYWKNKFLKGKYFVAFKD